MVNFTSEIKAKNYICLHSEQCGKVDYYDDYAKAGILQEEYSNDPIVFNAEDIFISLTESDFEKERSYPIVSKSVFNDCMEDLYNKVINNRFYDSLFEDWDKCSLDAWKATFQTRIGGLENVNNDLVYEMLFYCSRDYKGGNICPRQPGTGDM